MSGSTTSASTQTGQLPSVEPPPKVPPPMPQHRPRHPTPPASALAAAPDSPQRAEAAEQFESTGAGAIAACRGRCPDRVGGGYCPSVRCPNAACGDDWIAPL